MSSRRSAKVIDIEQDAAKLVRQKWEGSGLTGEHAAKLYLEALDAEATAKLGVEFKPVISMKIPYFDLAGKKTKFFRVRYLGKLPGFAGLIDKPQRYAQPKGSLNEVYFPPLLDTTWEQIADDPGIEIWITEGELKAAALCAQGVPCIGLGGVDVWKSLGKGFDLLPSLDPSRFRWTQRKVVFCFDSDSASNDRVLAAQLRLAKRLHTEGAIAEFVHLPAGPAGAKVGLDDYLLEHTLEDLKALAAQSRPYAASQALWGMNEQVIAILDPPCIYDRKSEKAISARNFKEINYAHHRFNEIVILPSGSAVAKVRDTAAEWLKWGSRFELTRMTFAPGKPRIFDGMLNLWKGWGAESVEGDVSLWEQFMDFIFAGDKIARQWFERWVAYPIQYPGTKLYTAAVLWGTAQGTGKTLVADIIRRIYGPANSGKIQNKDLSSSFNSWAERKQFIEMDEITGGQARADSDYIKGMITQNEVRINAKYVAEYTLPDCINYLATSNHPDPFFVDDNDRRFFIQEVRGPPLPDTFYRKLHVWKEGNGPSHLRYYLEHLDLGDFDPRARALQTQSKLNMIEDARSDLGAWVALLKADPKQALRSMPARIRDNCEIFTPGTLLSAYDEGGKTRVTVNGLGKELKRQGIRQLNGEHTVRTALGASRLYAVRNVEYWHEQDLKRIAEHFNQFFGNVKE